VIYQVLFQASGDSLFAAAALRWFERTLALHEKRRGVAGYQSWMPSDDVNADPWRDDDTLLTGAAGIGLALLSGLGPISPGWSRMLGIALPGVDYV
jgi:hypothetical protein